MFSKSQLHAVEAVILLFSPKFFHVDPMCSFNMRIVSGACRRNEYMFQLEQGTLDGERMNLMYLRIESPGVFYAIIRLNFLDWKGVEPYKISEKDTAFCGTNFSEKLFENNPCSYINCRILIKGLSLRCFDVFRIHLNLFSRNIGTSDHIGFVSFCDTVVPSLILLVSVPCEFLSLKE